MTFLQPTRVVFSQHEKEYVLHIPQYGLREGGGLSIPPQQALHYRPIRDDSFLAAFFPPCPPKQPLSEAFAEQYSGFVLEKAHQSGPKQMGSELMFMPNLQQYIKPGGQHSDPPPALFCSTADA